MDAEITKIMQENKINDLKFILEKRHFLNCCNSKMIYFFHIIQSMGILATSYSGTNGNEIFLWIGIMLNMLASLIQIYEKINNDQMDKMYADITNILKNEYIDESAHIDMELATKKN